MKTLIYKFFILLFLTSSVFGWGRNGHFTITTQAYELLKGKLNFTEMYKDSVIAKSNDPDKRIRFNKHQAPWHYVDIDFYKEFNELRMIEDYDSLLTVYPDSVIKETGTLPWVIQSTYIGLVKAFKSKDVNEILLYSSDLAHFVADSHMPLHTTINYDGQLTNQKGVHSRYESKMVDRYLKEIKANFYAQEISYVKDPLSTSFKTIYGSFSLINIILSADISAAKLTLGSYNDLFYQLMWKQTEYITYMQMNIASKNVASYIYSAWVDAGKPQIDGLIN